MSGCVRCGVSGWAGEDVGREEPVKGGRTTASIHL